MGHTSSSGRSELTYFLGQQDATKAAGSRLQVRMEELQKQYAADLNAALCERIREREAFVTKLQNLRGDAQEITDPALLPALESLIRYVQEGADNLKPGLEPRGCAPNPDRAPLKDEIGKLQNEIESNGRLAKTLAETIKSIQDDHRREGVASELDALVEAPVAAAGHSPAAALAHPEKEDQK